MVILRRDLDGIRHHAQEGIGQQLTGKMVVGGVSAAEVGEPAILDVTALEILPGLAQPLSPIDIGIGEASIRLRRSPK